MNDEIWKDIEGYEGLYQISNLGRVRSLDRIINFKNGRSRLFKGKIFNLSKDTNGYLYAPLCKNGKYKNKSVHRLVAQAFLPNPNNLPYVNHKDENKTNNCIENLEWCTPKYNTNYGTSIKRRIIKQSKQVVMLDLKGNIITTYPSIAEINKQLNYKKSAICECCNQKRKTAYGYNWKYLN